tara:strand:- start:5557 stop:6144 length:588 start_codon:yes stop_codon:yes gene_type:complete
MFTGIVESLAKVVKIDKIGSNLNIRFSCPIANEFKVDQSISHDGICLTVTEINNDEYTVVAVKETINKSNISQLVLGSVVNIERSLKLSDRLDGHIVQGHVDTTAKCVDIIKLKGSWIFSFIHQDMDHFTVEKGSVCVNGISLTVVNSNDNGFSTSLIPYTYNNTNFKDIKVGSIVNIEFDILGKYISKIIYKDL